MRIGILSKPLFGTSLEYYMKKNANVKVALDVQAFHGTSIVLPD